MDLVGAVLVANLYICACSLFREPNRRTFNAIIVAVAGAAYLAIPNVTYVRYVTGQKLTLPI